MLRQNLPIIVVVGFLVLFPHIVGWITGEGPYGVGGRPRGASIFWQGILVEAMILVILAMSYNLLFGFAGMISFGHAFFFGIGGYTFAIIAEKAGIESSGVAVLAGVTIGMLLAGLAGFLVGLVSLRLRGVYFAIFTLAVSEMAFIYVGRWAFTNAEDGFAVANIPAAINPTRERLAFYYLVVLITVLTFLFIRRLINSPTGRVMLAIRENEDRAQAIGYYTLAYKLIAITVSSMLAALAGILLVAFNKKVGPEIMSVTYTIDPLLMIIIGGMGTFVGPVVGAAGLQLSERIFNREFSIGSLTLNIGDNWSLILGMIFILVVLLFPKGIVGTFNQWRVRRRTNGESTLTVRKQE